MRAFVRLIPWLVVCAFIVRPIPAHAVPGRWMRVADGSALAPAPRMGHAFVLDPARQRAIAYGGYGYTLPYYDLWALSIDRPWTWAPLYVPGTAPAGRLQAAMVRDPSRGHWVMFGGNSLSTRYADTWRLASTGNLAVWNRVTTTPGPLAREAPAVWDSLRDRLLIFGGYIGTTGATNELWSLSTDGVGGTWSHMVGAPPPPSARFGHTLVLDTRRDRMLVFGGLSNVPLADIWALTLTGPLIEWHSVPPAPPSGPAPRYGHVAIYDAENDWMLIFGGFDGISFLNDAWILHLDGTPRWEPVEITGPVPEPRDFAGAVWDSPNGRLLVFGGNTTGAAFGDTWALTLAYTPLDASPVPSALAFAGASPNPAHGDVWLAFTLPTAGNARARLFDAAGRMRGESAGTYAAGSHRVHVDTDAPLAPGLYWAELTAGAARRTARVAVVR